MNTQIFDKARKIIESCETKEQAETALKYLDRAARQYPYIDFSELRELYYIMFSPSVYER